MKIPKTFLPEKDLEEKIESLAKKSYPIMPAIEEKIDTQEFYQLQELKSRWKKWGTGVHLNKPGTDKKSFYRLSVNTLVIASAVAVSTYLGIELNDYLKDYFPRSCYNQAMRWYYIIWILGSIPLAYRGMAEFFMRYDLWKYNKRRNKQ